MTSNTRENQLYLARLAEQVQRYEEMLAAMQKVVTQGAQLSIEERNLLSLALKGVIGPRRMAWRNLAHIEQKEQGSKNVGLIKNYRAKIEAELNRYSNQMLNLIDSELLPKSSTGQSRVFYYKMKGDTYRYIAQYATGNQLQTVANKSLQSYQSGLQIASAHLKRTSSTKLGLILNYCVLLYEIINDTTKAIRVAKEAFDGAISELDTLDEDVYQDTTSILQLIRDNLTLWTEEDSDGQASNTRGHCL